MSLVMMMSRNIEQSNITLHVFESHEMNFSFYYLGESLGFSGTLDSKGQKNIVKSDNT